MIKYSIITPYGQYVMMGHWTMREHTLKELDKMDRFAITLSAIKLLMLMDLWISCLKYNKERRNHEREDT